MKKYIFAAVFVLLVLIVIFTADDHAEAHSGISPSTTSVTAAVTPPPQITTTTATTVYEPPPVTSTDYGKEIVSTAEALIGIDFAEGGDEPSEGFDNSGFIYYVLRENGYISCPRKISGQLEWGSTAELDEIKAGDVLYFSENPGGPASFGGIYAGNGIMIYSPYPGEKVKTADITAHYWQSRFVTALSL